MKNLPILFLLLSSVFMNAQDLDIQGHRGCRGLMPENTIPAFMHALDLGVTTLELDVVITKDKKVVVSHEPFMSHVICTDPDGNEIKEADEKSHNIYELTYEEVQKYDCGSKKHPDYPQQRKMKVHKPLLSEVIEQAEQYVKEKKLKPILYNIEIKRKPKFDGQFHPNGTEFADLVLDVIYGQKIEKRTILQCFDKETLQIVHEKKPDLTTALLIFNLKSFKKNIKELGYTPPIYSPYFKRVNEKLMKKAKKKGVKVIPWTVNEKADIKAMLDLGVEGIISDYPDRIFEVLKE